MPSNLVSGSSQRIDIGTLRNFGSLIKQAAGWTFMGWVATTQQSVFSLLANFSAGAEGAGGTANQSFWWMLNAGYTTDYVNDPTSVLLNFGDFSDTGKLRIQTITSPDFNDGTIYHHALTFFGNTTAATWVWYINGVPFAFATSGAPVKFDDPLGSVTDLTAALAIGAHKKASGIWFDHSTGGYEGFRVYNRALTAAEVNEVYKLKGRDNIRGVYESWPLWTDYKSLVAGGTAGTAVNSPTFGTTRYTAGFKKKQY